MKGKFLGLCISLMFANVTFAEPVTPERGSALRSDLLDTVRVKAANDLGPPLEFVVQQLLVDGDHAFAMLAAQRPGGTPIDMSQIPMNKSLQEGEVVDGPSVVAFLFRKQGRWFVDHFAVGAGDVWWEHPEICQPYAKVMPARVCN